MVRALEERRDRLQPAQHPRDVDTAVVEHGIVDEQLVEPAPLLGIDDVPVLGEELIDQNDVCGIHLS